MVSVEAMVSIGAMVYLRHAWMTAPEAVTGHSSRLTGRVEHEHDRQCGERHNCQLCISCDLVHDDSSLSPSIPLDDTVSPEIQPARHG